MQTRPPDPLTRGLLERLRPELEARNVAEPERLTLPQLISLLGEETVFPHLVEEARRLYSIQPVDLEEEPPNPVLTRKHLDSSTANAFKAVVLREENGLLYVALAYPTASATNALRQRLSLSPFFLVARPSQVEKHLRAIYAGDAPGPAGSGVGTGGRGGAVRYLPAGGGGPEITPERYQQADDLVPPTFELIVREAVAQGVSDIHLRRDADGRFQIYFRLHGRLAPARRAMEIYEDAAGRYAKLNPSGDLAEALLTHAMVRSDMRLDRKHYTQDGAFTLALDPDDPKSIVQTRVSLVPTVNGLDMVIRVLPRRDGLIPLEEQGWPERDYRIVRAAMEKSKGIFLVTGPTGSGKSTTLASIIDQLRQRGTLNIVTIEEPVEYRYPTGVTQIDIASHEELTFSGVLRAVLRHDPDVILVGEIRDQETARTAVQAANTGHLVLATLHTNTATGAVGRLAGMGVPPYLVGDNMLGVAAVRLVPLLCPHCRIPEEAPERAVLRAAGFGELLLEYPAARTYRHNPEGCSACKYTGYRGRRQIHETFAVTRQLKDLIVEGVPENTLRTATRGEGMTTLDERAARLYLEGEVGLNTALELMGMDLTESDANERPAPAGREEMEG